MALEITKKIRVRFVVLDEGEYLYDPETLRLYECAVPHLYIGDFDLRTKSVKKKKQNVDI